MSKSVWMSLSGVALIVAASACAEGLKVEPQETVAGNGGSSGDGGRRNEGGNTGDGGRSGRGGDEGPSSPSASSGKGSTGSGAECDDGEVACADGSCVPTTARCDGDEDCPGGEDELSCGEVASSAASTSSTASTSVSAASSAASTAASTAVASSSASTGGGTCPGEFECSDSSCIDAGWECDGETDCGAGNDEDDCDWTCDPAYFGAGDGCDCGCGAPDPDCIDSFWDVCDFCGGSGSCALFCFEIDTDQNWACGP